ncbi:MAG: hypothetical protein V4608_15800 [Bacteroidota bacterium]
MKKTILSLVVLASATIATAQESGAYKAVAGNKTIEFGFTPLGGSPISITGFQVRSFKSDKMAYRANIFLALNRKGEITQDASVSGGGIPIPELKTKTSSFEIGLAPGVEKHWEGTERLSPYMGLVLDLGFKSSKKVVESSELASPAATEVSVQSKTTKGEDGFIRMGLMLPVGFDYYIAKHLYLGAEMGLGLSLTKDAKVKTEQTWTTDPATTYNDQKGDSQFNFGPTVNAKIRLGFAF